MALFSKPGGEPNVGGGALEAPKAAEEPNAAPAFPTAADRLDAFQKRAAIAEHDGGLTREDAERLAAREIGQTGERADATAGEEPEKTESGDGAEEFLNTIKGDADQLVAALARLGPVTQGAAASAMGWGASRAWRAEAALRARGVLQFDNAGRASLVAHGPADAAAGGVSAR